MKKLFFLLLGIFLLSFTPKKEKEDLNKENLWRTIVDQGIKFPDLVFAQALLESGDLRSSLCVKSNNLFGMKMPTERKTVAKHGKNDYAKYDHWVQSVRDYKLLQEYLFRKREYTRSEYVEMLSRRYSETRDYVKRVRRVLNENKSVIDQNKIQ
jgi:hypothetical protein